MENLKAAQRSAIRNGATKNLPITLRLVSSSGRATPFATSRTSQPLRHILSGRKDVYVFTAFHTVTRPLDENTLNAARNSAGK
jgi:hypothetical protein